MAKLQSMDVTLRGVTRKFTFDPATPVDSNDDGEASLEVLADAETTEVVLVADGIYSAQVEVSYVVRYEGTVTVDLEDLEGVEDADEVQRLAEMGEFSVINDAINNDLEYSIEDAISIDSIDVIECFDEDGNTVDL
jgi:hypothetical protein